MKIRLFRLTLGALGLCLLAKAALGAPQDRTADSFRLLASELVVDLDRVAAARPDGRSLTIAVWPHPVGRTPVPESLAQEYNDRLLAALLETGGERHRFVARAALRAVVADIAESSDLNESLDQVLAALADKAQADVLVVSKLRSLGADSLQISYRAVDVRDGTILAATSHRRLALLPSEVGAAASALSLEQALEDATDTLVRRAPGLRLLHLTGLRFEDSGQETPLGRYIEGRLADGLVAAYENPLTGRSILLRQGAVADTAPALPPAPAAFELAGTYWDFGEVVELRLSLADAGGVTAVWRGQIKGSSLPAKLHRRPLGPLAKRQAAPQADPPPPGPSPASVRRAQRNLQRLGYDPGRIDGAFGPRTRAALQAYQDSQGLPADGALTLALAARLDHSATQVVAQRAPAPEITLRPSPVVPAAMPTAVIAPRGTVAPGGRYCREYAKNVIIGGRSQPSYGSVCQQPDGSWTFAGR